MLTHLDISTPACPIDVPAEWIIANFGPPGLPARHHRQS